MSQGTSIQWCDDTANPTGGCTTACELRPGPTSLCSAIKAHFRSECPDIASSVIGEAVDAQMAGRNATELFQLRASIGYAIITEIVGVEVPYTTRRQMLKRFDETLRSHYICYAHQVTMLYGFDVLNPSRSVHPGLARQFEGVEKFPGRIKAAAAWTDLYGKIRKKKPWLDYLPRLIFVSDMGDALSAEIDFEYLRDELISPVSSDLGQRHLWLWLTKNPKRMAEFGRWLQARDIGWPQNLVAMTSVTSQQTACRAEQLLEVPSRFKGLSVEPLWAGVTLPLAGIDLCIVGGQSGDQSRKFDLAWAEQLRAQCAATGTAFFLKQLGAEPWHEGKRLTLKDGHGGDWSEWPPAFRIRQMPKAFYEWGIVRLSKSKDSPDPS